MNSNKLLLKKKNRPITEENQVAAVTKNFFVNIAEGLDIKKDDVSSSSSFNYQNISNFLEKHQNHPSLDKIRQTFMTET